MTTSQRRWWLTACKLVAWMPTAWILIATAGSTRAAEPMDSIPNNAAAVIRFSSMEKFLGNAQDMLQAIGPLAQVAYPQLENNVLSDMFELGNSGKETIDGSAPAYAVVFPIDGAGPPVLWFVKTSDETALRKAVLRSDTLNDGDQKMGFQKVEGDSRSGYFAKRGPFVAYTLNEQVLEQLGEADGKLAAKLTAAAVQEFEAGDAALLVNAYHLTRKFKSEIEGGKNQVLEGIDALPEEQLGPSGAAMKTIYKTMLEAGFKSLFDCQWFVGRANMNNKGLVLSGMIGIEKDSPTDKYLANQSSGTLESLGLLPAKAPIYAAVKIDGYGDWLEDIIKLNLGGAVPNEAQFKAAMQKMKEAGSTSVAISYALPSDDDTGLMVTSLQQAAKPTLLREGFRNYVEAVGKVETPQFTQKMELKKDAEKYKKYAIDVMSTKFEFGGGQPEVAAVMEGMFKRMFGGDALETRVTQVENFLVQATGNTPQSIQQAIDRLETGEGVVGLEPAFGAARDALDAKTNMVVMMNLPQLVLDAIKMIRDVQPFDTLLAGAPFNFNAQVAPSYSGFSLGVEPQAVKMKVYVPVDQPKGFMQIFVPAF